MKGFISYNTEDFNKKEGEIIESKDILVFPTIPDSLIICGNINNEKTVVEVSILGDTYKIPNDDLERIFTNKIQINKILSYDEIVNTVLEGNKNFKHLIKFLSSYQLKDEDQEKFCDLGYHTWLAVEGYQKRTPSIYKDAELNPKRVQKKYEAYTNRKKN